MSEQCPVCGRRRLDKSRQICARCPESWPIWNAAESLTLPEVIARVDALARAEKTASNLSDRSRTERTCHKAVGEAYVNVLSMLRNVPQA